MSVTPRTLTVTGANNNVTYSGVSQTNTGASYTGNQGSDSFTIVGYASGTNASATAYADNLNLTAVGSTQLTNYNVIYNNGGLTIGKANLAATGTMVYDATTSFAGGSFTSITGVNGETFSASGSGVLGSANVQSSQHLSSLGSLSLAGNSGALTSNYNSLTTAQTSVSVTAAPLTIGLQGPISKIYDGQKTANLTSGHYVVQGWAGAEGGSVNQTSGVYSSQNVVDNTLSQLGLVTVNLTPSNLSANPGTSLSNYTMNGISLSGSGSITLTGHVGVIMPAQLNINVTDSRMFVTQTPSASTVVNQGVTYSGTYQTGFAPTDTVASALSSNPSLSLQTYGSITNATQPYTYENTLGLVTIPTASYGNYNITVNKGKLIVDPAGLLIITIPSVSSPVSYGATTATNAGGLLDPSTITAQYFTSDSNRGYISTLSVTPSGSVTGQYNAVDSTGARVSFLVNVTNPSISTSQHLNVGNYVFGTYPIAIPSNANFTGSAVNGGTLIINPAQLNVSGIAADHKIYDGTASASINTLNAVYSGLVSGDNVTVASTGAFTDKNVADGKTVSLTNTYSGRDIGNYYIGTQTQASTVANITPATLTIGAVANTKTYDGTKVASATPVILNGLISGDTVSNLTEIYSSKNVAGAGQSLLIVNGYTVNDGNSGGNYNVLTQTSLGTINKAYATVTANSDLSRVYNGVDQTVTGFTATGLVNGETDSVLTGVTAGVTAKNAGTYTAVASGVDGNYNLNFVNGTLKINQATLHLQANGVTKVYDGTTALGGIALTPTGVFSNDDVSAVANTGAFVSKDAASSISFNLSGLRLSGTASANYTLGTTTALSGMGSITPKSLTLLGSAAQDKVYDGSTQAVVEAGAMVGLVGAETLALASTANFPDAAAGSNKAVLAVYTLSNGTNGGLSSNYTLANETLQASITAPQATSSKTPFVNPVSPKPPVSPSQSAGSSSRIANQQFSAEVVNPEVVAAQCSVTNPEACGCQNTLLAGVSLCMAPSNEATAEESTESVGLKISKQ